MTATIGPRRFALLGNENLSLLTIAIHQSDAHRIVALALTDRSAEKAGQMRLYNDWESLLEDDEVEAVIVSDERPEVLEFARQLAAHGMPLIVPMRVPISPEFVAEMSLLDAEGTSKLIPCFYDRQGIDCLCELIRDGRLGTVKSIQVDRSNAEFTGFGREYPWFSCVHFDDIDWLRVLGGDYSQVTLIRSGGDDANSFVTQTLQLAGSGLPDATCTYRRSNSPTGCRIRVDGSKGTADLQLEGDDKDGEVVLRVNGVETSRVSHRRDFSKLLTGIDRSWRREPGSAQWRDFVRVHEISEAMQRSLRRRRTIDLHFETASERSQFKTQMATVGCFVLVYTFFASVAMLFAGAVLDPRDDLQRKAESAGFVILQEEFETNADQLTTAGDRHLIDIAQRWQSASDAVVIVETKSPVEDDATASPRRDQDRLEVVRHRLAESALDRVTERTTMRPLVGSGFRVLMMVGRVFAFAPLGVFLLMQLLLFVARPPRDRRREAAPSVAE
ncbi:MAG: hypothetical protein KDA93_18445 [Planctomycetaceae bacterium]|nr:hypothetical protein [Planctomycetaceae bacterium]